ncbi:hypothetical protein F5Y04DRAFT_290976 [Hypomontagnella monticulosa]|nr:hypothetical protein F5Y04DRAFT_290976 [Hypomontagnella monticulosa]
MDTAARADAPQRDLERGQDGYYDSRGIGNVRHITYRIIPLFMIVLICFSIGGVLAMTFHCDKAVPSKAALAICICLLILFVFFVIGRCYLQDRKKWPRKTPIAWPTKVRTCVTDRISRICQHQAQPEAPVQGTSSNPAELENPGLPAERNTDRERPHQQHAPGHPPNRPPDIAYNGEPLGDDMRPIPRHPRAFKTPQQARHRGHSPRYNRNSYTPSTPNIPEEVEHIHPRNPAPHDINRQHPQHHYGTENQYTPRTDRDARGSPAQRTPQVSQYASFDIPTPQREIQGPREMPSQSRMPRARTEGPIILLLCMPDDADPQDFEVPEKFAVNLDKGGLYVFDNFPDVLASRSGVENSGSEYQHEIEKPRGSTYDPRMDGIPSCMSVPRVSPFDFEHSDVVSPMQFKQELSEQETKANAPNVKTTSRQAKVNHKVRNTRGEESKQGKPSSSSTYRRHRAEADPHGAPAKKHTAQSSQPEYSQTKSVSVESDDDIYRGFLSDHDSPYLLAQKAMESLWGAKPVSGSEEANTEHENGNPRRRSHDQARTKRGTGKPASASRQRRETHREDAETNGHKRMPLKPVKQAQLNGRPRSPPGNHDRSKRRYSDSEASESRMSTSDGREA